MSIGHIIPVRVQVVHAPSLTTQVSDQDVPMTEIIEKSSLKQRKDSANGYKCSHCENTYENARALGGHVSKVHIGMSEKYNRKLEVREKRADHRVALRLAKMLFERYSESSGARERTTVTLIRNVIMNTRPEIFKI